MLTVGFVAGICVTLLFESYIFKTTNYLGVQAKNTQLVTVVKQDKTQITAHSTNQKPVFDFYTQLTGIKNMSASPVPSDADNKQSKHYGDNNIIVRNTDKNSTELIRKHDQMIDNHSVVDVKNKLHEREVINIENIQLNNTPKYRIQIASLKGEETAKLLQKKLKLLSVETKVKMIKKQDGSQWYRVQAGPFFSLETAKNILNTLVTHNLEGLLIKQSDTIAK